MKKFKAILNIFSWVLSFFMFLTLISLVVLTALGYRFFSVSTGSMEPTYPVGALVAVQPAGFDDLAVGDVVTFKSGGAVVTHRIVSVEREGKLIYKKGDNNTVEDSSPVPYENVIGRVVYGIKLAGYLVLFGKTRLGIVVYTSIIILIFLARVIASYFEDGGEDDEEDEEEEKEKDEKNEKQH